ncbi:hypothetical protein [Kitasatospora purpeofusca]|uniref:hypothetical protein n=1 Tax=Kitasatospora purpeofusca TaxID=67352 RepID=UPI0036D2A05C
MISNEVAGLHAQIVVQTCTVVGGLTLTTLLPPSVLRLLPRRRPLADRVEGCARLSERTDVDESVPVLTSGSEDIGKTALVAGLVHGQIDPGPHSYANLGGSSASGRVRVADVLRDHWSRT